MAEISFAVGIQKYSQNKNLFIKKGLDNLEINKAILKGFLRGMSVKVLLSLSTMSQSCNKRWSFKKASKASIFTLWTHDLCSFVRFKVATEIGSAKMN